MAQYRSPACSRCGKRGDTYYHEGSHLCADSVSCHKRFMMATLADRIRKNNWECDKPAADDYPIRSGYSAIWEDGRSGEWFAILPLDWTALAIKLGPSDSLHEALAGNLNWHAEAGDRLMKERDHFKVVVSTW